MGNTIGKNINYLAIDLSNKQLGTDNDINSNFDLTDGLSAEEIKKIDKNGDGAISESEFKKTFNGKGNEYKKYWDVYTSFYNTATKKDNKVKQEENGVTTTSKYDEKGKLVSYTQTTVDSNGLKTTVTYKVENGKAVKTKTTTNDQNGHKVTTNEENNNVTRESQDGTKVTTNPNGQITQIKKTNSDGTESSVKVKYNDKGEVSAINIDGKKYTNVETKNGTTIVKDKDGNVVYKIKQSDSGTNFISYKDGKKSEKININKDGNAEYIVKYNKNGKAISKEFCDSLKTRKYKYDGDKLVSSTDYSADGVKLSTQTYSDKKAKDYYENKSGALWESRTYYDENGKVSKYEEYSYKKGENGEVIKITTIYDSADKNTKIGTKKETQDSYGNVLESKTKDSNNNTKTTSYTYNENPPKSKLTSNDIASSTTTTDSSTITKNYEEGKVKNKEVTTIKDGKGTTTKYQYEYYANGKIKKLTKTSANGSVVTAEYDMNGNKVSKNTTNKDGSTKFVDYLKDGTVSISKATDGTESVSYKPTNGESIKLNKNNTDIISTLYNISSIFENEKDKSTIKSMIENILNEIAGAKEGDSSEELIKSLTAKANELLNKAKTTAEQKEINQLIEKLSKLDKTNKADVIEQEDETPKTSEVIEPDAADVIKDSDSDVFKAFYAVLENTHSEEERTLINNLIGEFRESFATANKGKIPAGIADNIISQLTALMESKESDSEKAEIQDVINKLNAAKS